LAQTFAAARDRPFARWLRALGMPLSDTGGSSDWAALSGRAAGDWQSLAGIGAGRANQLVEFFSHPEVRAQAARLHAAGVQGF
jgi:DNA ligase (NAD+)